MPLTLWTYISYVVVLNDDYKRLLSTKPTSFFLHLKHGSLVIPSTVNTNHVPRFDVRERSVVHLSVVIPLSRDRTLLLLINMYEPYVGEIVRGRELVLSISIYIKVSTSIYSAFIPLNQYNP